MAKPGPKKISSEGICMVRPWGSDLRSEAAARMPGDIFELQGYVYCVARDFKPIDVTGLRDAEIREVSRKELR